MLARMMIMIDWLIDDWWRIDEGWMEDGLIDDSQPYK